MSKIRILNIIGNATMGGVASSVINYCKNMDLDKYQFDFVTYGESELDNTVRELGGNVYYTANFINFIKANRQLSKILSDNRYDIVHSHLTSLSVFPLAVAKRHNVPIRIIHAHSTSNITADHALVKAMFKVVASRPATVRLACGDVAGKWLYGNKSFDIVNNAIDLQHFCDNSELGQQVLEQYNIEGKVIGFVGRFAYQKNLPFLVKCFAKIASDCDAVLMLVGDGEERDKIERLIARYQLQDRVVITGKVDNVVDYYNCFDLMCLPSRYEGLPMVAVEAQACGVPLLMSDKITSEVDIRQGNQYCTLNIDKYSIAMLNMLSRDNTTDDRHLLTELYDITTQTCKLDNIYQEQLSKIGF